MEFIPDDSENKDSDESDVDDEKNVEEIWLDNPN